MMKKIIGWIIVTAFVIGLIAVYAIEIYKDGWFIMLGLLVAFFLIGIFLFGVYLIESED